ncbi:ABC transporter ATP-binding protein [Devosia sp.]|uniref:ABC transporter ATP-binding protein n=1 Tax=Devosia sp. TaxID=1871048 RepID=UPI0019DCAA98|nr:ABC transporter ATP-binding protein [Devosia sp.]MBE0578421.1 ABC transporter ATP-binding protein [Devosia sp.]
MNEPHLVLTDVHRHYGQGDKIIRVLDAANLTVHSGELVALVAPSGAGKSTLLHISGLLESPQGGEVAIMGIPTSRLGDRGRTQLRRSTVGYVYQFHHLLPEFTALENVSMPQLIAGKSPAEADKRSLELLDLLGVAPRASHRPAELSGGEQQRIAIARAAANHPKVILADEPTGNLDPETSDLVFAALANLIKNEGAAALIATHNHDLARRADRIVTLKGGLVVDHTL